eukprot:6456434-Alexandrium_andersonii.AAC.1
MSASLVGSEMCIRDRRPPTRGRKLRCLPPSRGLARGRSARFFALNPVAVSYTHLTLPTICSV